MNRRLFALLPLLLLSGCVAVWGQSYNIDTATADTITLKYDANFTTAEKMQQLADRHCAKYGKKAVLQKDTRSIVHIDTAIYDCK